jgi:hypothetical protein
MSVDPEPIPARLSAGGLTPRLQSPVPVAGLTHCTPVTILTSDI